jgi:hypothetical protein
MNYGTKKKYQIEMGQTLDSVNTLSKGVVQNGQHLFLSCFLTIIL